MRLDQPRRARLTRRIETMREALEHYFGERFGECQPLQILRYGSGDFFRPHYDNAAGDPRQPARIASRRIAVIVFLNDAFRGGNLNLYGPAGTPVSRDLRIRVEPKPGLAVAFRADIIHEVTRIRSGVRYSLVTWFT